MSSETPYTPRGNALRMARIAERVVEFLPEGQDRQRLLGAIGDLFESINSMSEYADKDDIALKANKIKSEAEKIEQTLLLQAKARAINYMANFYQLGWLTKRKLVSVLLSLGVEEEELEVLIFSQEDWEDVRQYRFMRRATTILKILDLVANEVSEYDRRNPTVQDCANH